MAALSYYQLKQDAKKYEENASNLKPSLEKYLEDNGVDMKESTKACQLFVADKEIVMRRVTRSALKFLPEATDVLKANGLTECIEKVEVVREDVLERMAENGQVSPEIMKKVYAVKQSHAFYVDVNPRVHEEEA